MKTTSFSQLLVTYPEDTSDVHIEMRVPGEGSLSTKMTPEELLMFIVELGNGLTAARKVELLELQKRNLEIEKRRAK